MGFRFFKRIRIAPGVTLNLSRSGGSISVGPRGAKITVGPTGTRATAGIPGTGLFYTKRIDAPPSRNRTRSTTPRMRSGRGEQDAPVSRTSKDAGTGDRLELTFLDRLRLPRAEESFVDALRAIARGDLDQGLQFAEQAAEDREEADGCYLAGSTALALGDRAKADAFFRMAFVRRHALGRWFARHEVSAESDLPITDHVVARITADERGVLLVLAELAQERGAVTEARDLVERLYQAQPSDVAVRLSLAELIVDQASEGSVEATDEWTRVVALAGEVANESALHAGLLLQKAVALRRLGMPGAARDVLTGLLRRTRDRDAEFLRAVRYERALAYEDLGRAAQARRDLETIFAEAPDHEDVAVRLGISKVARTPGT